MNTVTKRKATVIKFEGEIKKYTDTYFSELSSKNTRVAYRKDWNRFLEEMFNKSEETITRAELETIDYEKVIEYRRQLNLANSSINRAVNTVKSVLTYLVARKILELDLLFFKIIKPLKNRTKEIPHMPIDVVHEYIEETKNEKYNSELKANLIMFAVDSGLRLNEILNLRLENFTKGEGFYFVDGYGKRNKKYRDKISTEVYNKIKETYIENEEGYIFFPLTEKVVIDMMIRIRERLGYQKEGYSFHSLRKTAITYTHDLTGNLLVAQRKANHTSPTTTNTYIEDRDLEMTGYFSTIEQDSKLFEKVEHDNLIEALREMPTEFLQLLNNKLGEQ